MPAPAIRQVVLAATMLSSLTLGACRAGAPAGDKNASPPANVAARDAQPAVLPAPETRLDREALLIAVFRARSAAATGIDDQAAQAQLDGKRFEFRIRLACSFSADQSVQGASARYNEAERRVELEAAPNVSLEQPIVAAIAGEGLEAVEGFWVPRPWLLTSSCAGAQPGQANAPDQTAVALAQFYTQADARTERRDGRPYEAREKLAEGAVPAPGSWDLVLRGRLRKIGGGRVILCRATGNAVMPACIISASFEEVLIEKVDTREVLARWARG